MSTPGRSVVERGKKVLSVGYSTALLRSRNIVIEAAGYHVVTTKDSDMLIDLARKQDFAAAVLCNSIPAHLRSSMARQLKQAKPTLPLIILCTEGERLQFRKLADEVVIAEDGLSQPLIEAISRLGGEPD